MNRTFVSTERAGSARFAWLTGIALVFAGLAPLQHAAVAQAAADPQSETNLRGPGAPRSAPFTATQQATLNSTPDYPGASWVPASPANYDVYNRPYNQALDMIVIHTVQGSLASAEGVFQNPASQSSAHYVVGQSGQVVQMVQNKDVAWHAGNYPINQRSIGIEHEGYVSNAYPGTQYVASANLSAYLIKTYQIPFDRSHIIGHSEVPDPYHPGQFGGYSHHTDPGVNWDWNYYMALLTQRVGQPATAVAPLPATSASTEVNVAWGLTAGSSGVSYYNIEVQDNGGPWTVWRPQTNITSGPFYGLPGHTYSFWAQGVNYAGSNAPQAQATVKINANATSPTGFSGVYAVDGNGVLRPGASAPVASSTWGWDIARSMVLRKDGHSGYTLDGWGGIHPFGGAPAVALSGYWPGWDIARSIALRSDGVSGYVLDGWGGVHPFGGAPAVGVTAYWAGWDIAKAMVLRADGVSGYVLDGFGGVHPFGGAPWLPVSGYWSGWDIARSVTLLSDDLGGYVLDGWGGLHAFGAAPPPAAATAYWPGWDIARSAALLDANPAHPSGYVLDGYGAVHPFGGAPGLDTPYYSPSLNNARVLGIAP